MTIATVNTSVPFGAITMLRLVNATETVIAAFVSWNARRRTHIALSSLSDHLLSDIGLSRGNLRNISFQGGARMQPQHTRWPDSALQL
jgi:uncharacterized protein YjiS (DUF1127 family)